MIKLFQSKPDNRKVALTMISSKARVTVGRNPEKQRKISKEVKKIFDTYGKEINELSRI